MDIESGCTVCGGYLEYPCEVFTYQGKAYCMCVHCARRIHDLVEDLQTNAAYIEDLKEKAK